MNHESHLRMGIYVHQRRLPHKGRGAGTLIIFTVNAELSQ